MSLNCRGLGCRQKRQDLFSKIKEDHCDIALLQDTHWDTLLQLKSQEEWGYKLIGSPYSTQSRGTAIIFNDSFEFEIGDSKIDEGGNFTLLELTLHTGLTIIIGSIYAPNQDNPHFIKNLQSCIEEFENPNILLGGDWNSTRNFQLDNINYKSQNNFKMTQAIDNMMTTLSLVDAWRINNPTQKKFTWSQGISNKHSRLDFFLCNEELMSITKDFKITTKYRSDHASINCKLMTSSESRGPGIWKLNYSLLMDKEFEIQIKKEISNFKAVYAATPYNPEYIDSISHGFELMISPILFWEALLASLRGTIIRYAKRKKAKKTRITRELETNIKKLDEKVSLGHASQNEILELSELNNRLIEIRKDELKGIHKIIRSRADWLEHGEKPSKYFLNLENRNRINKSISEIKLDENHYITDQSGILETVKKFYEELYKNKDLGEIIELPEIPQKVLNQEESTALDQPLTKQEIDKALNQQINNKSPGSDGYSAESFKKFWPQLGNFFYDCVKESFRIGKLTTSQSTGLITCLPKGGKARNLLYLTLPTKLYPSALLTGSAHS